MDSTKGHNTDAELHLSEVSNNLPAEIKEESQNSFVTFQKMEAVDGGETSSFIHRQNNDPESLESVHKYASRIKSFLGWESEEKEKELLKDQNEPTQVLTKSNDDTNAEEIIDNELETKGAEHVKAEDIPSEEINCEEMSSETSKICDEDLNRTPTNRNGENDLTEESFKPESSSSTTENIHDSGQDVVNTTGDVNLPDTFPNDVNLKNMISLDLNNITSVDSTTKTVEQKNSASTVDSVSNVENDISEIHISSKAFDTLENECVNNEKEEDKTFGMNVEKCLKTDISQEEENKEHEGNLTVDEEKSYYPDETMFLNKNVNKPYMEGIRRLSLDIVKDVIDSARNSIHEKFSSPVGENSESYSDEMNETSGREYNNFVLDINKHKERYFYENKISETDPSKKNISAYWDLHNDTIDEDTICGFGCFRPKWLQKYATPRMFLILFSIMGVIHGIYDNYFVLMISTLEKRYTVKTKVSGILLLADEIMPLLLGIPVGYIGSKTHRPRMVAIGMFLSAACCFVTALPYAIYGPAKHLVAQEVGNETNFEYCDKQMNHSTCDLDEQPPTMSVVGLFVFASFLKGFATLSYYVIGIPYIDDNAKKKNTPIYLGIALALRLLGPLLGFLMSSGFLKLYENPLEDPGFGPDDPRWIGAWWMGFVVQGVLLVIFTLPIALFPRRLPSHSKPEPKALPNQTNKESWKDMFTGLLSALKRLARNPVFVFLAINTVLTVFGHFGPAIMLPKYMENQFRLSASDASLFSGATSIACIMVATVFGGFLIWKYRPTAKMLLAGMIASEFILVVGYLILTIPGCEKHQMMHFGSNDRGMILDSVCNQNCSCSVTSFTPFCGSDGKTMYFSPCYAGCTQQLKSVVSDKERMEFGNCSCVADAVGDMGGKITEGFCPDDNCWTQALAYICLMLTQVTISNTLTVAHTMILLRSVHPNDKSVALGTFETFICLFGFIPFPITFGALVDSACLVWEKSCGETGNCWFYDLDKYNYFLHGAASLFCAIAVCCLTILYCLSARIRSLYKDEEDEQEDYQINIKLDTVSGTVTKL